MAEMTLKVDQGHCSLGHHLEACSNRVYLVSFLKYLTLNNGVPLKSGLMVIHGH